jgi:hypothetical protein
LDKRDKTIDFFRKREPGEIIQSALEFARMEYKPLLRLIAVYVVPFLVLYAWVMVMLQMKLGDAANVLNELEGERALGELSGLLGNFLVVFFFHLFVQVLLLSVVYTYVQSYIASGEERFPETDVVSALFPNSLKVLSAGMVAGSLSLIGFFLCILPGILIANSLSLAIFIAVHENKGLSHSLLRSWILVRRQWWVTLSLNIIGLLFVWLVSFTVSLPVLFSGFTSESAVTPEAIPQWHWWISGLSVIVSSIASTIPFLFLVFQYFNLTQIEEEEISQE